MIPRNDRAPGAGHAGGQSDQQASGSLSILASGGDTAAQLIGVVLRCATPAEANPILYAVPAEAFEHPLDQGIWRAAQVVAAAGECDPVRVVQTVVAAGLWPRDLHHEVTVRMVDAIIQSRFDTHEWQTPAADVLTAYARRTAASRLALVANDLGSARPQQLGRDLLATAALLEAVAAGIEHIQHSQVGAA
jgi:hypothetical protein